MDNETEQIFIVNTGENQSSGSTQSGDVEMPGSSQLENVEDFSRMCRSCATVTEFVIPIFSGEGLQNNLADKIQKHLPIRVCESDILPRVLCYQCASTLLAWHELVQCCVQADVALRARLLRCQQKPNSINIKSDPSLREPNETKFSAMMDYVSQGPEPPQHHPPRTCPYCSSQVPHHIYKKHLITEHSHLLFYCEECSNYINKRVFMTHMSYHAKRYPNEYNTKDKRKKNRMKIEHIDVNLNISEACKVSKTEAPVQDLKVSDSHKQQNDFSDPSDTEFGFEPLSDSLLKAIEDSQDGQPLENTGHTLDNGNISNSVPTTVTNDVSNPDLTPIETDNIKSALLPDENTAISNLALPGETNEASAPAPENSDIEETDPPGKSKNHQKKSRTCPICCKEYRASSSYFYHMKYFHKGSREHECDTCSKKFGTRASLTQHKAVHSGQYEFECKQCKKQFKSKASLYIHEQTHDGKKLWSCNQCHTSFRWKTHLLRHMKRHTAEKAHVCTTCGRGFNIRCDLLRHARTHTAGNFACDKCDQKFAQLRYLKVHTVKKH